MPSASQRLRHLSTTYLVKQCTIDMPGASLGIRLFVLLSVFFVRFDIRLAVGTYVCVCVYERVRERASKRE